MARDALKIHKGELVVLAETDSGRIGRGHDSVGCWRRTNKQEDDAWHDYVKHSPMDDAGEPRIRSSNPYTTDFLPNGTPAIVIKARCTANIGWDHYGKLVQVIVPSNGNTYYVQRKYVAKAVSDENTIYE
jgi:hypothetical protein